MAFLRHLKRKINRKRVVTSKRSPVRQEMRLEQLEPRLMLAGDAFEENTEAVFNYGLKNGYLSLAGHYYTDGAANTEFITKDTAYRKKCRMTWAALIKCVYEVDPLKCPVCGGTMKVISFVTIVL